MEINSPVDKFKKKRTHCQMNLDDECATGSNGIVVKVIVSIFKNVTGNMDDFKDSITIIQMGVSVGWS